MEHLKIKNKLRKIYPNNHENFKNTNSKCRVQLLTLKECTVIFITIYYLFNLFILYLKLTCI